MTERINLLLVRLRKAMSDLDYTHDALAAAMTGRPDRSYVTHVINGEKPLSTRFLLALPKDIRARLAEEDAVMHGLIVVKPSVGEQAVQHLISGLMGVLAPRMASLPARADHMARAHDAPKRQKRSA